MPYMLLDTAAVRASARTAVFVVDVRKAAFHQFSDHRVRGAALLPGVAMLELVSCACSLLTGAIASLSMLTCFSCLSPLLNFDLQETF